MLAFFVKLKTSDIYFTTDGSEPNQSSTKYTLPFYINKNTILKVKAYKTGWVESDLQTSNYQMKTAPVDFDPQPGTYSNPIQVSLGSKTDSAIIHYTLDGSQPSQESAVYDQPIYINNNTVVNAIAFRSNFDSSIVTTGSYIFSGSNINAVIKCDSVWVDSDFYGYEEKTVDGSESSITNDTFYYMVWLVNGDSAANVTKPKLKLRTGTNEIVLIAVGYKGEKSRDTVFVNVYSAKLKTAGSIYSAPAKLNNTFFVTFYR